MCMLNDPSHKQLTEEKKYVLYYQNLAIWNNIIPSRLYDFTIYNTCRGEKAKKILTDWEEYTCSTLECSLRQQSKRRLANTAINVLSWCYDCIFRNVVAFIFA